MLELLEHLVYLEHLEYLEHLALLDFLETTRPQNMTSKIHFQCDYTEGAHPSIMQRLIATNMEQTVGYGEDPYCDTARRKVREACNAPDADVHFLVGGTQTNATLISHTLRPYEGVIAADTAHIAQHETGAIEHAGHKVLTLPARDGKISAQQVRTLMEEHLADSSFEHTVRPAMVYISFPTELGTLYSKAELQALRSVCDEYKLPLFLDGARLGYGLAAPSCDVTLEEIAQFTDVFYIGGTKVGALFGEALVINHPQIKAHFRYSIKQGGGMLAKGRLLGLQFDTLFTDNLMNEISQHAIHQALRICDTLKACGISFLVETDTNQLFPILPNAWIKQLESRFQFSFWQKKDEQHSAVRICTSWATTEENVNALIEAIQQLHSKANA